MTDSDGEGINLSALVTRLYADRPTQPLFHYTSLDGMRSIVEQRALWATEIRYLNDAKELAHLGELLRIEAGIYLEHADISDSSAEVLRQFRDWLAFRFEDGPLLFVACFTEAGNLLSQWRGYCSHGKGVRARLS